MFFVCGWIDEQCLLGDLSAMEYVHSDSDALSHFLLVKSICFYQFGIHQKGLTPIPHFHIVSDVVWLFIVCVQKKKVQKPRADGIFEHC